MSPLPATNAAAAKAHGEPVDRAAGIAASQASRCPYERAVAGKPNRSYILPTANAIGHDVLPAGALVLVGVDHHTAPVELRERFHHGGELSVMLDDLRRLGVAESVILFTCNRFEVYATVGTAGSNAIIAYLADRCGLSVPQLLPNLYSSAGSDAALHLMRVASGLESIVIGEPQILGQVSDAFAYAQANDAVGTNLTRLFTSAVHAGKRARTETGIGRHTLSIPHAAVLLLKSSIKLATARVVVLGAGEMAGLAVGALRSHGASSVQVVNRTLERAETTAQKYGVNAVAYERLPELLRECDAVIAATSSQLPLISADDLAASRAIHLIDLGVPRNIDAACGALPGIRLYDVDALQQVVEEHRQHRLRESTHVESLLEEELADYLDWIHTRKVTPLISDLRRQASEVVEAEIEHTLRRLPQLDEQGKAVIVQMAHRIVGKLLHSPTMALKSRDGAIEFAHAVRRLFALEETPAEEAECPKSAATDGRNAS
jgi:glutamyl-tRNA reductase